MANFWEQDPVVKTGKSPWDQDPIVVSEEVSQLLDPAKMFASGAIGPTAAIPLGIESSVRNIPRQVVEQQGITPVSKVGPLTFAEELVKKGPAQLLTNTAKAFIKKATGESFEKQQERQTQDQIAVDRAISGLPRIPGLSQLADAGERVSGRLRESVSAAGKQAIADSQVEGNLLESIQNQSVENLSFGKNPSFMGYALQGSQVLGSLVPIITTAVVTKGSSKAVGTVGFGMGAGEAVKDATEYVGKLSDEQLMQSSPYFKKMVEDGINPAEARKVVTDKAAEYAAQLQGSVSAFGSVITGKLITGQFDKLMTGPVKNRLGRIALGTTAGSAEEGTQEFLEGIAKDLGINKAVIKEIGEESFANFVLGAMGGAGPGAYRGAVAKTKEEAEKAAKAPTQADIDAQMRAALGGGAPPAVPPAAAPVVTPPITPAQSATIEEAEVEAIAPAPRVAPTPTPMLLQTAGLQPEVAGQVQNLEGQFQMIEQRKLDPNLTEEELQIFNERQNIIQQEISQLIQAPSAPQIQAPVIAEAPPINEELMGNLQEFGEPIQSRMDAEQRLSNGEQIYGFLEQDENRPRLITSVDDLAAYTPEQLISLPTAPEIVQSFPMGENSELQVIKNDKGYVTNLYDKDADQYLGMMRLFPTETFGEEAEAKAIEFARSEADKAVKFEPAAPAEEPLDLKSEQAYRMRITVEELEKDSTKVTARNVNPLAKELNLEIGATPQETLNTVKETLGMPAVAPAEIPLMTKEEADRIVKAEINRQRQAEQKAKAEETREPTVVELPKKEEAPAIQITPNKIFTEDAATKARNRLRSKLNQLNSGIDPEFLIDGITLSGYHIEKGARTFAAYAKAMIADLGDKVKPYLKQWYNAVRDDPSAKSMVDDMDTYDQVQKAELPDTTEGAVDLMDPSGKFKIAEDISKHFLAGNGFKDILDARKFITNITGQKIEAGTAQAKEADEAVEVGIVLTARDIVQSNKKPDQIYDDLLSLYNRQPNLAVRTSTSISEQAYSTPAPLAYVASQLAGINKNSTVFEPTAGNGMLLIDASPKNVIANELNGTRYEMLERVMDGATINNENAVELNISREFDAVIANPPFGVVKNREGKTISYDVDGFKSNEIDHAIAFKALNNMKDDGRAVLIVGGVMGKTEDSRRENYRSPSKRNFYYNLYQKYNVVDHFTVSGDLYKKQGAAYPVDVIVIAGKGGESIELPAANVPKVYSSYEQLKEKLDEASRMVSRGAERPARADLGEAAVREGEPQAVGRGAVRPSEPAGTERIEPRGGEPTGVSAAKPTPSGEPSGARTEPRAEQPKPVDVSERGRDEGKPVPRGEGEQPAGRRVTEERKPSTVGGPSIVSGERVKSGLVERRGEEVETAGQVTYEPHSQATSVGTLVPRAMRDSIEQSLQKVENEMGSLDEYVSDSIGMDLETLREDFSAEQIDALALAIRNAEAGKGFIIGDQTGIGKGRVVAAMIKFAIRSGKIPIFVTEKPNLYSDMIRDLDDIGMTRELALDTAKPKIFITNGGESIPYQLLRKKGDQVEEINLTLKAPKSGKALDGMMEELRNKESIGNYKVIFTTYSQLQTVKGKDTERQRFIKTFGAGNYMIFDESHNAGGAGETQARSKEQREAAKKGESLSTGRSAFVRNLVNNAFGTFFSSATYAKRPDVMDLYSSTNMMLAVDKPADLAEAIKRGGVPMQQIVATMLTKDGQYIRRERTFAGIAYNTIDTKVEKETAENMATAMRDILAFSRSKDVALKQMQKTLDKEAKMVTEVGGEKTTVQGANFGSVMHNLIDQMLLSLKAKDSVRHAIDRLKAGEKVVMTVSNTMGSFLQSYAEDMNINVGERLDLSFADLYIRYLDKQLMITIKTPDGKKTQRKLTPDELGPTLMARYNQIRQQIENSGFGSAPISPIDYMHSELRKAGYKTDEITGRTVTLNYTTGEPILTTRSANIRQRVNAVRGFNGGDTDVIILNQAGSTGLSLHASNKVKDQSKRHMIIVQAEKNIDVHVQTLGRVNRTGQVVVPAYSQMMADIPAEMRPAAVLLKKMASLNANTTASRKSAVTAEGVVDFMNDYGGQVAQEYLRDNPEIHNALGGDKMLAIAEDTNEALEADIRRFTGYIPILPLAQQEEVYADLIDRYNELLERENSMGNNRLEAKAFDLDAETLSVEALTEDKGEDSVFSTPAFMERVDVKRTVKPYSSQEIKEMVNENLGGKTKQQIAKEFISEFDERENKYFIEKMADLKEKETDPIKIDEQQGRQRLMAGQIRSVLQNIQIGDPVTIKDKNGVYVYGMITDIKNVKRTVNPASGSDWKMILAVANGDSKSLTLNFSQIGTNYTLEKEDVVNYLNPETQQGEYVPIIDIFDKGASVRREKRWMITGNILAGFAQYPGQILTYTKNDGTTGQGILMSRQFDFEREKKSADVRLKTPQDMMRFLDELGGTISSDDNVIRITKRGDTYMFDLPSNKRSGGEYFLDKNLTDILGRRDFYKRGSSMLNYTRDPAEFAQAIDYLMKEKEQFFKAVTYQEQARKMFAPKTTLEDITGITPKQIDTRRDEVRAEQIKRSAELSRGISAIKRQIIKGNIGINIQRELTFLEQSKKAIAKDIERTKPPRKTAEWVRAKASTERAANNIDEDTYKVVEALATRYPAVLDGLTLSMLKPNVAGVSGNFDPVRRIVTLYKGSATDKTMRHEIAHSMEQMMTPEAQVAVVNAWADALKNAIENNTDQVSQDYFEAVFDYLQNPTEATYRKATDALPDYKLYQFINPSEYWAVNAEPLLKAQLGGGWQRFKKAMQRLLETIKDVLGFDNKRAIHREFSRIMSGDQQRITNQMLVEYVTDNADSLKFLNNIEDFKKKFEKDGLNHTPVKPSRGVKDMMLGGYRGAKQVYKDTLNSPLMAAQAMGGKIVRAITYARNKNIWFGAGLEMADLALQKAKGLEGMLRDGEMRAVASIAVTNALHAGHIASEVIVRGALAFNAKTQMFQAIRRPFSMANVLMAKHDLLERMNLQDATDLVNTFFEAKRSKSIMDEFKAREKELNDLNAEMSDPRTSVARQALLLDEILQAEKGLRMINIAKKKVRFDEKQIKFYSDQEKQHPELRTMLDNWTKVNDNMIDMMLFGKIIGEKRAKQLKGIKDYVPWYRIQDDMQDLHQASQMGGIKRLTNVGKEKRFEDTVVVQDIDDIVDNMLHNVAMITRNSMRNYAANRVAQQYATRNKKGQIAVFPEEGRTPEGAVRTNILVNGRRIIIEIKDPLIAESVLGMENISMPVMDMLGALANGLRRGVTLWPQFQIRQLFMDAPTAALVTGLKDPTRVWAGTFRGFIKALQSNDPVVDMLKSYGIGGYQSYTRTPEIEYKQQIGLMENNKFDALINFLDRVGDASDYGQRVSVYNNTLRQTGDEMLALLQANNVIDFLKRGSARHAQFLTKTVSFMNAYAQQIDILAMSLVGKRLTGKARGAALAQLAKTGATFGFYVMLYSMAVGDDDEYQKLDDQTKVRNIFLSKNWTGLDNNILLPMHTSASFMFKAIPELTYNYVTTQGTKNEMDGTRLRTALREAAFDSLLGPNLISTGVKPFAEITLNRNFFTGSTVTPKGMEDLDAVEQYTAATSQAGKVLSAMTGIPFTENKRVLNPIEADHLVRGLFGTTGSFVQYVSNMFSDERPSPSARQNPVYGSFVAPDVARGNEDLFYDFKKRVDNKYETYMKLLERDKADEADKYFDKNEDLISARDYVTSMEVALRDINLQIRMAGEVKDKTATPEQRRQEIIDLQRTKQEILDGIIEMRLESKL